MRVKLKILARIKSKLNKKYNKIENFLVSKILDICPRGDFQKFPSATAGHYNFLSEESFYKIAIRQKKLFEEEKQTITKIKTNYTEIGEIIPEYEYGMVLNDGILFRKSAILEPIEDELEQYQTAEDFLEILKKHSTLESSSVDNLPNLKKGLEIVESFASNEDFQKTRALVEVFLKENTFRIGFCHGDFHSRNFMKDKSKKYLIDFDCVREKSIQEFDAIYFIIQKIIDDIPNIWWYEASIIFESQITKTPKYRCFLEKFMGVNNANIFILLYFLDRIGQDSKYFNFIGVSKKQDIIKTLNQLINIGEI